MADKRSIFIDGVEQPYSQLSFAEQIAAENYGLIPDEVSDDDIREFIERKTSITKAQNWSQMNMSTAQGGALLDDAYGGAIFDGRYVYYVPYSSDTFVRFDTQGVFTTAGDWDRMNMSTAQGGALLDNAYLGASFDGRYVYYVPNYSDTFVRFDTLGVFTTAGDWDRMNMSTAQGGAELDAAYRGYSFDGRYVYYVPYSSDTFLRFDSQGVFTTSGDWDRMNMSTAQGSSPLNAAYIEASFDGRYVYFVPYSSDTFLRFDTQGVFTTSGDWDRMNMSTAQGGIELNIAYLGASFDGRYVYYVPNYSNTFLRFDTLGVFTTTNDWDKMNMSTAQGGAELDAAYRGSSFDGRYVYFVPRNSDTFVRSEAMFSEGNYP